LVATQIVKACDCCDYRACQTNDYDQARVHMFDWIAEEIIRISDDSAGDVFYDNDTGRAVADHARIQRDRLRVDSRKWLLSKQDAKRYGDKLAVGRKASKGCPFYVVLAFKCKDVTL